jgi:hypothetical protein
MKQVSIEGFTYNSTPENRPAICCFGEENVGKSRFGCTAPHEDGLIGWLALDKNSKGAVDEYKKAHKANHIMVNAKPLMTHTEAIKIAMEEDPKKTKVLYKEILGRVFDMGMAVAEHKDVESVVVDDGSQLFDWILFSHFGRRNQIESYMRGAPNNDMIEFVNAMGGKNLVMICRGQDIWADTGEVDKDGKKKQAPTGKLRPEGFGKIGKFMTAVIELTATRKKLINTDEPSKEDIRKALATKYHCKVVTCKGDTLLEGQDLAEYGICGEDITWENVMHVIKAKD